MTPTRVPRPEPKPPTAAHRAAVVVSAVVLALLLVGPAPTAQAAAYDRFYANFAGEELMRAINADRVALGKPAYTRDATLAAIARDRPATCPSNASLTIRGRARDMADRNYLSHTIPGCTLNGQSYDALDLLATEGYSAVARGEDISSNNFPSSATSYATGCSVTATSCHGSTTLPWTVEVVERGFMSSSGHRANLLSTTYTRFGCGAWRSSSGTNYYSCYFTQGGNGTADGSGPAIGGLTGVGASYPVGSTPTLQAGFTDGASLLADGWMGIDGKHVRDWAWDHAGSEATVTVTTGPLTAGSHTVTWWVRDTSTNARSTTFQIHVGGSGTPPPTPRPTPRPTPAPTTAATGHPGVSPSASRGPSTAPTEGPTETGAGSALPSGTPAVPDGSPMGSAGLPSDGSPPPIGARASGGPVPSSPVAVIPAGVDSSPADTPGMGAVVWVILGGMAYVVAAFALGRREGGRRG